MELSTAKSAHHKYLFGFVIASEMGFVSASDGLRDGRQRIIRSRSWVLAGTVRVSVHANMGLNSFSGLLPSAFACHADDSMPACRISRPGPLPCNSSVLHGTPYEDTVQYELITVNGQLCKWRRCLAASSSLPKPQAMWKRSARTAPLPVPFAPVSGPSLFGVLAMESFILWLQRFFSQVTFSFPSAGVARFC